MTHFDHLELLSRPKKWEAIKADMERGNPTKEAVVEALEKMLPQAEAFLKKLKENTNEQ